MSNTCNTCGQEVDENFSPLKAALMSSCDGNWRKGWTAVYHAWNVGDFRRVGAYDVTKVFETDSDELDGYGEEPMEMVFEVGDEYWKITGTWSSYDGMKWNDTLVRVEKKERTSTYYG